MEVSFALVVDGYAPRCDCGRAVNLIGWTALVDEWRSCFARVPQVLWRELQVLPPARPFKGAAKLCRGLASFSRVGRGCTP
jgi:hypothetical protein